jgi:hypothetical protein
MGKHMAVCPVCSASVPQSQLDAHVDGHFNDAPMAAQDGDGDEVLIACPLGCGLHLPLAELENHELAHQ